MKPPAGLALILVLTGSLQRADSRVDRIERRGHLGCGVEPAVSGFAEVDANGRYRGLDVDVCRALSAAIFGTPEKVRYSPVLTVAAFLQNDDVDVVSRRLSWELQREASLGLLFGPVTFYDGQGFLVAKKAGVARPAQLAGKEICVAGGTGFEFNLESYFGTQRLSFKKVVLESAANFDDIAGALASGRCPTYTADVSELGAIRARMPNPGDFDILADEISKEPLAPLVRKDDGRFFTIVRWTIFALIRAEELHVTSANVEAMRRSPDVDVQRLLGVVPGNGRALGLDERWAYNAIKAVGNYGEMFDRNVGRNSAVKLERGLNRLSSDGGLMYAPPLR